MNHDNRDMASRESSMLTEGDARGGYKCVADVMTRKTVTLNPHHGFTEAVSLMADRHFRHIVVADTAGQDVVAGPGHKPVITAAAREVVGVGGACVGTQVVACARSRDG